MNLYQRRKAERDAKRKLKYQEKRELLILHEAAEALGDAMTDIIEHKVLHSMDIYLCGCKGEDNG